MRLSKNCWRTSLETLSFRNA